MIRGAYQLLGLQTYFTAGEKEVRAWTVKAGSTAPQAAGVIHTDFERGFIRAEVIGFNDFIACKGEHGAKEAGKLRLEGKEYIVTRRRCHALPLQRLGRPRQGGKPRTGSDSLRRSALAGTEMDLVVAKSIFSILFARERNSQEAKGDGDVLGLRFDNWKVVFIEQRCKGTLQVWAEPFTKLRVPKLFNLRTDPFGYADLKAQYLYP